MNPLAAQLLGISSNPIIQPTPAKARRYRIEVAEDSVELPPIKRGVSPESKDAMRAALGNQSAAKIPELVKLTGWGDSKVRKVLKGMCEEGDVYRANIGQSLYFGLDAEKLKGLSNPPEKEEPETYCYIKRHWFKGSRRAIETRDGAGKLKTRRFICEACARDRDRLFHEHQQQQAKKIINRSKRTTS